MLMHVIAHGGCVDTVRESALEVDSERSLLHLQLKYASILCMAFQRDTLPAELFPATFEWVFSC